MIRLPDFAHRLLAGSFRGLRGSLQWRVLWATQHKYIVGVSGVVHDDRGRILVLRHRYWSAAAWGLPGGYMKAGETPAEALAREVREETGLSIRDVRTVETLWGLRLRAEVHLSACVVEGDAVAVDGGEVLAGRFVAVNDLPAGMLPAHRRRVAIWQAARDRADPV
jgi:8-oxo-dGTP diphosphatase